MQPSKQTKYIFFLLFTLAIVSCVFVGEAMAGGKGKGGDDIILYNGNIVLRPSGKGKGKGGSIVVANSQPHQMEHMESMFGFGRR